MQTDSTCARNAGLLRLTRANGSPDVRSTTAHKRGRGFQRTGEGRGGEMDYETYQDSAQATGRAQKSVQGWIVVVTNVHEETTEEDMLDTFSEYGVVRNLHLNLDRRTGFVKGYALAEYDSYDEAGAAVAALHGHELYGKTVEADFAFARGSVQELSRVA